MVSENEYSAEGDLTIKGYTHKAKVSFLKEGSSKNMKAKQEFFLEEVITAKGFLNTTKRKLHLNHQMIY